MKRLFMALPILLLAVPAFAAESYTVDPRHTFPSFEVNHMGISTQRGRFNTTSGKITLDRENKKGSVDIEIKADSISTGLPELEKHLKGEDFFNTAKYPNITFKSAKMAFEGDTPKSVEGDITLLGVTKPATFTLTSFNCRVHPMNKKYVCGGDASTTIKRSDFGMTYAIPGVSDDVKLLIQIEAFKDQQ